ncbi:GNAT family N-acetyltransferase [Aspergillus undulatus]|uniref:GNAT family N-acetyltransferase n=1 Tax=Aspergillus undulatus TaxID=1810928 RepID=UPI003CCE0930
MAIWRNLTTNDIEGLMRVADAIHPGLPESAAVFVERIQLYPEGCLALETEDGQICGYAISHPIREHQPPVLDTLLWEISPDADAYYIHDVAILPGLRGRRLSEEGIGRLFEVAKRSGYPVTCLVSVYGTERFWARFGFRPENVGEDLRGKLRGYGDDAVFLSRSNGQKDTVTQ